MQNFILASFCSRTDWFESYSVRNPQERFSSEMVLMYIITYLNQKKPYLDVKCMGYNHKPCRSWINTKLTRLFTARIHIVWKEVIDTVYVRMYNQHSNVPAHSEKKSFLDA